MKRLLCLLAVWGLILGLAGCKNTKPVQKTVFAMDTVMDLQIWGADAEAAAERIASLLTDLDRTWSAAKEESLIGQLNRGKDIALTEEQSQLLTRVQQLSEHTSGAFDPQMLSVSRAWGFYEKEYRIPTEEEISLALSDPKWDLGAALKGYAGDRAVALLENSNVDCAILNLGGNIQTYGQKADKTPWQIGIQNPGGSDYVGILSVVGTCAVVTSGDYQRYFEKDGIRYHHIMDPETGCPADSGLASVTVICRNGLTADALSTALFVMGLEKGTELWRQSNDFEAVFITTEGEIYATAGAALSGCEYEVIDR
ncbi:MAG: FAD:protein FMN transferase [Oscillospiraceae bacterium]|nr:FAD:protein FMN transferase [Oscillospiraceae bacterium]